MLRLEKVNYYEKLPTINPYKLSEKEMYLQILLSKGKEWAYEEEFRLICGNHTDFELPLDTRIISKVFLESLCSEVNKEKTIEMLDKKKSKISLYSSTLNDVSHEMEFKVIDY